MAHRAGSLRRRKVDWPVIAITAVFAVLALFALCAAFGL
jgi:hypothetical protein